MGFFVAWWWSCSPCPWQEWSLQVPRQPIFECLWLSFLTMGFVQEMWEASDG